MTRDAYAARRIAEERIDRGWSPEALSYEVSRRSPQTPVSGRTIRRIEASGMVPTPRVMFGISLALDLKPSEVWSTQPRRRAAA